jgi:hypothetical protein
MRHFSAGITLLMCFWALAASAAESGIVFAVWHKPKQHLGTGENSGGFEVMIDPIAYVINGRLVQLGDERYESSFSTRYYLDNHRYAVFSAGRAVGSLKVGSLDDMWQCTSVPAIATYPPATRDEDSRDALASDIDLQPTEFRRRVPSADEERKMKAMARNLYRANGVSDASPIDISNIGVFADRTRMLVAASFRAEYPSADGDNEPPGVQAGFIIAEGRSATDLAPAMTWFHSGEDASVQSQTLVDIINLDGDDYPELVATIGYYETADYVIYRKSQTTWQMVYNEPASNCF